MTLNLNSFNAKLYRYFYDKSKMPDSICPYFWKLLMAWVFIIPVSLFSFPAVIAEIITKQSYGLLRMFVSFILYLGLFCIVCMVFTVMLFFNNYDSDSNIVKMGSTGLIFWIFAIVIAIIEGVKYFMYNNRLSDSVIVGFIKSKYNRYCAKITWK